MRRIRKAGAWLLFLGGALAASAQPELHPPATNSTARLTDGSLATLTNSPVRLVEPGIYEIGRVRLDQRLRRVTLPAVLNKTNGLMEYFLVTTYGKTHESILKTDAQPFHLHLAMLLLGAHGPGNAGFPGSPPNGVPGPVIHPSSETIPGDKVSIEVKWKTPEGEARHSAEDLIYKNDAKAVMERGWWVYNGSLIVNNKFLAQMDGSMISLVTDPVALVNYIGPGHDNDLLWEPHPANLPPPGVPVEVAITFQAPPH